MVVYVIFLILQNIVAYFKALWLNVYAERVV